MYIAASDYDGTLNHHGVSDINRDAIRRFRAAGNLFGVVTGRDYPMYSCLMENKIEFDFILALNGAMAIKPDGTYFYCERAENKDGVVRQITEFLGEHYQTWLSCLLEQERITFALRSEYRDSKTFPPCEADKITHFTHLNSQFHSDEHTKEAAAEINRRWGTVVNALQNGICLDIPPAGIDKGQGVARYAAMVGVPADNIYCIGDNMNDMAMITRFHGCAVANAREEVKEAAEAIYDGVWAVLDHIMTL